MNPEPSAPKISRWIFGHLTASLCLCLGVMTGNLIGSAAAVHGAVQQESLPFKASDQATYKQVEGRSLSLYLYKPEGWRAGEQRPAFVYFHGGGWSGGTLHQGIDLLRTVQSHGMVGINVEYRLADEKNPDPARCIQDAKSAIRFLRAEANRLGIDANRIVAGGHSAGGHLAAACALLTSFDSPTDDLQLSCKPNALALIVPVLDNGPDQGYRHQLPAIQNNLKAYSPAHNVSTGAPPTLLLAGRQDTGAHLSCLQRFQDQMQRAGNSCHLLVYEGGHGFSNHGPLKEEVQNRIVDFVGKLGWLNRNRHPESAAPSAAPSALPASPPPNDGLTLASVFSDRMILQRDARVPVWGWSKSPGSVVVEFAGQTQRASVSPVGDWKVHLDPIPASTDPRTLRISLSKDGTRLSQIECKDVLVGEVWFCSGQSNMETALAGNPQMPIEKELPPNPNLRAFVSRKVWSETPQPKTPEGQWIEANSKNRGNFYAVAYFFGKHLQQELQVPVGLIQSAWGGTPVQAWMSEESLAAHPEMKAIAEGGRQKYQEGLRSNAAFLASGGEATKQPWPDWQTPKTPTFLFNSMVHPFIPYAIRGVIWYQGEHNVLDPWPYGTLFPALIRDWRVRWGRGDFPFFFCQLPGLKLSATNQTGQLAILRAMQAKALQLPNTGMAVTYDTAEEQDNHPRNKHTVGERLARLALSKTFSRSVPCQGPTYKGITLRGNRVAVHFEHVGAGLVARPIPPTYQPISSKPETKPVVRNSPQSPIEGFQVRAENGPWCWANARIEGETVVVESPEVRNPNAVRYAWIDFGFFNLFNADGLPAPPFSSDARDTQRPGVPEPESPR